jgi:DnaJ-class molecular chaperone
MADEKPKNPDEVKPGTPGAGENVCRRCKGSGKLNGEPCLECRGTGKISTPVGGA